VLTVMNSNTLRVLVIVLINRPCNKWPVKCALSNLHKLISVVHIGKFLNLLSPY